MEPTAPPAANQATTASADFFVVPPVRQTYKQPIDAAGASDDGRPLARQSTASRRSSGQSAHSSSSEASPLNGSASCTTTSGLPACTAARIGVRLGQP